MTSRLWFIDLELAPPYRNDDVYPFIFKRFSYVANVNPSKRHWFFVAIGADQLLHFLLLALTLKLLGNS